MGRLVDTREAARLVGVAEGTVISWRTDGKGPAWQYHDNGIWIRYDTDELERFRRRRIRERQKLRHKPSPPPTPDIEEDAAAS